jgi:hypothetical protein
MVRSRRRVRGAALLAVAFLLLPQTVLALAVDFEDVGASLSPDHFVNDSQGFTSGGVAFNNTFSDFGGGFTTWAGFAYSNVRDSVTPGFGNQYAAFRPDAPTAGGTYAVGFIDTFTPFEPRITFASDVRAVSVLVANSTYTALSMRDGDAFAKKFGGATGHDPDFFKLTIQGFDAANDPTGSVEFYLADYRFADDALDSIVSNFTRVDLGALGTVRSLGFGLSSSDVGQFGMNTPAYFTLDDLVIVPEPSSALALACGVGALGVWRRRVSMGPVAA